MSWFDVVKSDERLREIDEQIKALKEERRKLLGGTSGGTFNITQRGGGSFTFSGKKTSSGNEISYGKDSITVNGKTFQIDPSDMRNLKVVNGRVWLNGKEIGGEE